VHGKLNFSSNWSSNFEIILQLHGDFHHIKNLQFPRGVDGGIVRERVTTLVEHNYGKVDIVGGVKRGFA